MIQRKVAFVLQMVDDFTGKVIQRKKFRFYRNGRVLSPIEKPEGMYVFLEPMEEIEDISIESTDYHGRRIVVDRQLLDLQNPVQQIRLYGKPGGSFPYRCDLVTGRITDPKAVFPAEVCGKKEKSLGLTLKEIKEIDGETHLIVNGFTKELLIDKTLAINHKKETEVFTITEKIGMNEYILKEGLKGKYPPKTPIERVYCSVTDAHGNYAIPVEMGEQDQITEVIILQNK